MEALFLELVGKYPSVVMVFTVVGVLRAVFKPIMAVAEKYVEATPTISDDELLGKVKASAIYKGIAWLVDYVSSIKLPGQK